MLSNAYFLAKFRFDTAENEPAKNLQNLQEFANFADPNPLTLTLKDPRVRCGARFRKVPRGGAPHCGPGEADRALPSAEHPRLQQGGFD